MYFAKPHNKHPTSSQVVACCSFCQKWFMQSSMIKRGCRLILIPALTMMRRMYTPYSDSGSVFTCHRLHYWHHVVLKGHIQSWHWYYNGSIPAFHFAVSPSSPLEKWEELNFQPDSALNGGRKPRFEKKCTSHHSSSELLW